MVSKIAVLGPRIAYGGVLVGKLNRLLNINEGLNFVKNTFIEYIRLPRFPVKITDNGTFFAP